MRIAHRFQIARFVLSPLLIGAAILKLHQPTSALALFSEWVDPSQAQILVVIAIAFEFVLGAWLLSGLAQFWSWMVSFAFFVIAGLVALGSTLGGKESCGCFGSVVVHPAIMLEIDLAIVVALLFLRPTNQVSERLPSPSQGEVLEPRSRLLPILSFLLLLIGGTYIAARGSNVVTLTSIAPGEAAGRIVILEPDKWVGTRLPILKNIEVPADLSRERWLLVLVRHDCPTCHKVIEECVALSHELASSGGSQIVLVEVPPFGRMDVPGREQLLCVRIDESNEWFVQTPAMVLIDSGIVRHSGRNALDELWKETTSQ